MIPICYIIYIKYKRTASPKGESNMERAIVVKFYSDDKYLPSYDKVYYYDLNDDDSFARAFTSASYRLLEVCEANSGIKGRIERVEVIA